MIWYKTLEILGHKFMEVFREGSIFLGHEIARSGPVRLVDMSQSLAFAQQGMAMVGLCGNGDLIHLHSSSFYMHLFDWKNGCWSSSSDTTVFASYCINASCCSGPYFSLRSRVRVTSLWRRYFGDHGRPEAVARGVFGMNFTSIPCCFCKCLVRTIVTFTR